jgi:hypothetical protein
MLKEWWQNNLTPLLKEWPVSSYCMFTIKLLVQHYTYFICEKDSLIKWCSSTTELRCFGWHNKCFWKRSKVFNKINIYKWIYSEIYLNRTSFAMNLFHKWSKYNAEQGVLLWTYNKKKQATLLKEVLNYSAIILLTYLF